MRKVTSFLIAMLFIAGGVWAQVPGPNLNEGFEGGVIPDNWTIINADGGSQVWNAQTANPHSGTYSARVRYETSSLDNDDWLITPPLWVTSSTTDEISFWLRTYNATSADPWEVLVSTTDTNPASFTMIDSGPGMLADYVQKTYSLDAYGDAIVYVAIRYLGAYDWYLYVDDFVGPPVMVPTCPAPTDLYAENLTTTTADLGWTASGDEELWNVEVGLTGFEPGTASALFTYSGVVTNTLEVTELDPATSYDFYVQADCGTDEVSAWAGPFNFLTLCEAVSEFAENFDAVTTPALPICWAKVGITGSAYTQTSNNFSPPNCLYMYSSGATSIAVVSMPVVSNLSDGTHWLKFMARANFTAGAIIEIGYLTDPTDPSTFVLLDSKTLSLQYEEYTVNPEGTSKTNHTLAFRASATPANSLLIDNVIWEEAPDCLPPFNLIVDNITTTSADLGWTPGGDEELWNVEYGPAGFAQGTGTLLTGIEDNPYTLEGLTPSTTYDFYVQADCVTDEVSTWAGPVGFATLCEPFNVPIFENFDAVTPTALPLCWSKIVYHPTSTFPYCETTTLTTPYSPPNHIRMYNSSTFDADAVIMLISPQIVEDINTLRVSFFGKSGTSATSVLIGAMTDPTDESTFNLIEEVPLTSTYSFYSLMLNAYAGIGEFIAFRHINDVSSRYIYLDDITIEEIPSCLEPSDLYAENITATSADLGWTPGGDEELWNVEVGLTGFEPGTASALFTYSGLVTNTLEVTGLDPLTSYDFYVQADCGDRSVSMWAGPVMFTTLPSCPAPTELDAINITAFSADLAWTPGLDELTWNIEWGPEGFELGTVTGTLIEGVTNNPYTLGDLESNTSYDFYVQADCENGTKELSEWAGPFTFTTACEAFELPFFEGFDAASVDCWDFQNNWNIGTLYAPPSSVSGTPHAYFYWSPSQTNYSFSLTSPVFDASEVTNNVFIDYLLNLSNYSTATIEGMAVEFKTTAASEWTELEVFTNQAGSAEYVRVGQLLPGMAGNAFQVRFRAFGENSFNLNGWGLDDIEIYAPSLGSLSGTVTEVTRSPIEGARVFSGDYEAFTDATGFYEIENILPGTYDFTAEADGYISQIAEAVEIESGVTTTLDFELDYATIAVDPESLEEMLEPGETSVQTLTITNDGTGPLEWDATITGSTSKSLRYQQYSLPIGFDRSMRDMMDLELEIADQTVMPMAGNLIRSSFTEGFDDIGLLPGMGWAIINNSEPIGVLTWFQGNDAVFAAHEGDTTSYIGANFNSTAGVGTISNWLITPEINFQNGHSFSFWSRVPDGGGVFPDRLEVRMSIMGSSTNVGTTATSVGDFTSLLLSINPELTTTGYPEVWTQFTVTISDLNTPTSGRIAFRYFVTNGGPNGTNSNYIGIDSFEYSGEASMVDWLAINPTSGTVPPGENMMVDVTFDATELVDTTYYANININHNGQPAERGTVTVPVELTVASLTPPEPATLIYPEDSATLVPLQPVFTWENGPGTAFTRVVITRGNPPFTTTVFSSPWLVAEESLDLADYPVVLDLKTDYKWSVLARNAAGTTPSDQFIFQTIGAGTIIGEVTDAFTGDPMEGVTITAEELRYETTTGPDGSYVIPDVLEGNYNLTASIDFYVPQTQEVEVVHGNNTLANFALNLFLAPPLSLQAQITNVFDVELSWLSPFATEPTWIHWDNGENFDAIGLTEGGTFSVAARFTPDELGPYDGFGLTTIAFFPNSASATYTLKVWKGADQANLVEVHSQPVTTFTNEAWNEVILTSAITVDASQELWFGFETTHADAEFPAGCDAGPAVAGFGDMIALGGAWDPLSVIAPALNYNWNLQGYLDPSVKGIAGDSKPYVISNMTAGEPIAAKRGPVENALFVKNETTRDLTGFNIYRDDVQIGSTTVAVTEFEDLGLDPGTYSYTVKAVYPQGESEPAGPKEVSILAPPTLLVAEQVGPEVYLEWESNFVGKGDNIVEGEIHSTSASGAYDAVSSKEEKMHGPTVRVPKATGSRAIGDDCLEPVIVDAIPFTDVNYTCGRGNNYDETCLGNYDGGEDIIYELVLAESAVLEITMSTTTTYTGMLISDECPPLTCIASGTNSGAGGVTLIEELVAGTYYIMIDTWPSPDCIPDFTLTIDEIIPDPGQTCGTAVAAIEGLNTAPLAPYWYEFTPAEDGLLTISSCLDGQEVDTDLIVYNACGGDIVAENDDLNDACSFYVFASAVSFPAEAGVSYKIQWLDTYTTDGFDFTLELGDLCVVDCPPDAIAEGELCGEDLNGGCNSDVPVFESIAIDDVICGTSWADDGSRDTDWFEVVIEDTPQTLTWSVTAEFPLLIFIIDGNEGCEELVILAEEVADPCVTAEISATVAPGTYWLWVGPSLFEGYPCGVQNNYVAELTAEDAFVPFFTVYRDGVALEDVFGTTYMDAGIAPGETYCYTVTESPQFELETGFSNELCVDIPLYGEMAVNPVELFEIHDPAPAVTTQTITVTNDGTGVMEFDIDVELPDDGTETSGLCLNPVTFTNGCSFGDGIESWSLANVNVPVIPCSGTPAWYKDYTDMVHELEPGETYVLTLTSGYSSQFFTIWIDFNNDLELTPDEIVLQGEIAASATPTTFDFTVPEDAPGGVFTGRCITKWQSPFPEDPCGTYSFGNVVDFMFSIGGGWLTAEPETGVLNPGESMNIDVVFNSAGLDYGMHNANINFMTNNPFAEQPEVVVPVELEIPYPVQDILMPEGWSGWSAYIDPMMDAMFEDVVAPVVDDMIITQYFTDVFYPAYSINTMGEFSHNHGYVTKMDAEAVLTLQGMTVTPTVNLTEGWNLFPVLVPCNMDAADVFGGITGFVIAYEVAGSAMYYPAGEVYTLTQLVPGKAYWVKVTADTDYTFPGCDPEGKASYIAPLRHANTTDWNDVSYTGLSHVVVFDKNASSMLVPGDVIGAFTSNGTLAGMTIVNDKNASLAAFGEDITTAANDGFVDGEQLSFKLYRHANQTEYILDVNYSTKAPNYDGNFANHGMSIIDDMSMTATGISSPDLNGLSIYPNPSDGLFNVSVDDLTKDVNYVIMDAKGQMITEGKLAASQVIDLSDQPRGVYFIKFVGNDILRIEKLVLR